METAGRPDCPRCRAFFITHDPRYPYGCRTFSMRTRGLPSVAVLESSGRPCEGFDPKPAPAAPAEGRAGEHGGWRA